MAASAELLPAIAVAAPAAAYAAQRVFLIAAGLLRRVFVLIGQLFQVVRANSGRSRLTQREEGQVELLARRPTDLARAPVSRVADKDCQSYLLQLHEFAC